MNFKRKVNSMKKISIALKFDPETDDAPKILFKGEGSAAEAILSIAEDHGIPVKEDPVLAGFLKELPQGEVIPENLYKIVSVIFSILYREDEKFKKKMENKNTK